ncbi:topoisomerase I [Olea europaea subsp. europaea]|uniref:Topoisomerase I n=1 Tax=Olea europaea subsp. europaea TaxID=158383 RepID=A0A8S0PBX1_OLEEU|nr:topoisomerase I [Olea europaea subsp. europaea]
MAADASEKPKLMNDMDEDDEPSVFIWSRLLKQNHSNSQAQSKLMDDMDEDHELLVYKQNRPPKQNQSNSHTQKPSSQELDLQLGRPMPNVLAQNGRRFEVQKSMVLSFSKSPPVKSPVTGLEASNSSAKASPLRSPNANLKPSATYRSENVTQLRKVEKPSTGPASTSLSKINLNNTCKGSNA